MYTTIAKCTPLYDGDPAEIRSDYDNFEDAELNGRRNSCLGMVIEAAVYGHNGEMLSYYNKLTNYWFTFKNSEGNFIANDEYFESVRSRQEEHANREGVTLKIEETEESLSVVSGSLATPIAPEQLPWVGEAAENVMLKKWRREDEGYFPYDEEELSEMFHEFLRKRIAEANDRNPHCLNFERLPRTVVRLS